MSDTATVILSIAALLIALGVIWTKAIHPAVRVISGAERMLPVLTELTVQLGDVPKSFAILREIIAQFRTDSGSSLRDVVDRLEAASIANRVAAEVLKVQVEAVRELAVLDRATLARANELLDRLNAKLDVASSEAKAIAVDLEASHVRAEAADVDAESGAAADAAMRRDAE